MKKVVMVVIVALLSMICKADEIESRTAAALDYIGKGYIQYGYSEIKKMAASNGLAAQYYLAVCYEHGIGVEKNQYEAFKMYRKTAERGLPDAMYQLARFYREGLGVNQDTGRENEWIKRFNQRGGRLQLPDLLPFYNQGLKSPQNYAMNPIGGNKNQMLAAKGNENSSSSEPTINNITIVQQAPEPPQPIHQPIVKNDEPDKDSKTTITISRNSDVDISIPSSKKSRPNVFVVIIANENYTEVAHVPYALNDGEAFKDYCEQALAIPSENIKYVPDATFNNIKRQINWLKQVLNAYKGEAKVIFYYAGHGIPDEKNRAAYLLPTDGDGADVTTGYALDELYRELGSVPAQLVTVILDACFSGSKREEGMLASTRGVAIKPKQSAPKGNMVVISAAQGEETAYPFREKSHGLFTYFLLKKLQDTQGNTTFGDLADYIIDNVSKKSIVTNGKPQTPTITASFELKQSWRSLTF